MSSLAASSVRHRAWRFLPTVLLVGALFCSESYAQPDLEATYIGGPGIVEADTDVPVTIKVVNNGTAITSDYEAKVYLSDDPTYDPADIEVESQQSDITGAPIFGTASIPASIPEGIYFWILRVSHSGMSSPSTLVGTQCTVQVTLIDLDQTGTVSVSLHAGGQETATIPITVSNIGTTDSILVVTTTDLSPAPWLVVEPISTFAIGGQPGNVVELNVDSTGVLTGTYSTIVRFQNFEVASNFIDLTVELTVGIPEYHAGRVLTGQIVYPGDTREVTFNAVQGQRVKYFVRTPKGSKLKPNLTIIDPLGAVEKVLKAKNSDPKNWGGSDPFKWKHTQKILYKVKQSGRYTMRISGRDNTLGLFKILTGRKLPKKARMRQYKIKNPGSASTYVIPVLLLPESSLNFASIPNSRFSGYAGLSVTTPSGSSMSLSGYQSLLPDNCTLVEGIEIGQVVGRFDIGVSGFGTDKKERCKVFVTPIKPPLEQGVMFLK